MIAVGAVDRARLAHLDNRRNAVGPDRRRATPFTGFEIRTTGVDNRTLFGALPDGRRNCRRIAFDGMADIDRETTSFQSEQLRGNTQDRRELLDLLLARCSPSAFDKAQKALVDADLSRQSCLR